MTSIPTRIAIAGAGTIGLAHMAAVQLSATVQLAALVDPCPAAVGLARAADVPLYTSLNDLLAHDKPDGVVLATPNQWHVTHALQCIEARVPALLEKPIAPTVAQAQQLVDAVDRDGALLLIGHHRAHSTIMARACEIVQSGKLGRLVSVVGSAQFYKPASYFSDAPWRSQPGAGPILLNMIHEVHNLRMLCGDIVAVQAFASHAVRGSAVEDTVAITLRFASGTLGTFMLSDTAASARSWEQTSKENTAYASYDDEDCYCISGTRGSLSVPTMRIKSFARDEDRSWNTPFDCSVATVVREDPIQLQMEHFGAVVRGEAVPLVTASDGLQNLRITQAIMQSAQSGQIISIIT
jgi:predicted dehydrogenase